MADDGLDVFSELAPSGPRRSRTTDARKRRRRRIVGWISLGVVVALVATVGVIAWRLLHSTSGAEQIVDAFPSESSRPDPYDGGGDAPVNILLLGTDTRGEDESLLTHLGDRADVIMVVHIPSDRASIQVMSIMRDSWLSIPGYGLNKVNAALSFGGVPLMVETVEGLIDQRIDHVAVIDFEGFKDLTDALGGVTVQNEVAFTSGQTGGDYAFDEGHITLDGDEALAYVRERYAFADGDYQRVRNQRAYLRGVLDALLTPENLANPVRLSELAETLSPYMALTDTLTPEAMLGLASGLAPHGVPDVRMFTLPTDGTGTEGGQSVVYVSSEGLAQVREAFAAESMNDFEPPPER